MSKVEEFMGMPWGTVGSLVCTGKAGEGVIVADCAGGHVVSNKDAEVLAEHIVRTHNEWLEEKR